MKCLIHIFLQAFVRIGGSHTCNIAILGTCGEVVRIIHYDSDLSHIISNLLVSRCY